MFNNSTIAAQLTTAHLELRDRAADHFTPEWLKSWRSEPGGPVRPGVWQELAANGFMGLSVPVELGGRGLGLLGALILAEALSRTGDTGIALGTHVQNEIACDWLASADDAGLRERLLPAVLSGERIACQCDTDASAEEPTTAVTDGDSLVINGRKLFVVNGDSADLCFVSVVLDGRPAIVAVEKERRGVGVGHVYDKFGTRSIDSARVEFDSVRVPATHVVSRRGPGRLLHWNRVMSRMRLLIAADAYFLHRRLLTHVIGHTTRRTLGGRRLADWPVNLHALARARTDLELMEAGLVDALRRLADKSSSIPEIAQLKWFCVERATELATLCTDLEGGAGYMWDSVALQAHAQVRGLRMSGGSQTTMLTIANHSLACRAELAEPGTASGIGEETRV
ncbi:acyl-CoA dehydrogenase family protein [Nocardiopsis sp. LOL_012]|uniref:acyl-CoA dehydrogenase family protein n=1 Tax=Nocardiopsis sp. LOL_012 TaxID=3345409 RepID=UPI003A85EB45